MTYYAGIDVSLETSSVCGMDISGDIQFERKLPSEADYMVKYFRDLNIPELVIGREAGPLSQWIYRFLDEAGFSVVLLETRQVRPVLSSLTMKTDRNDACGLAHILRTGWYRPVHVKTLSAQEVRCLLSARRKLLDKTGDLDRSIRGLLRNFGLKVGRSGRVGFPARIRELVKGHEVLTGLMEPMLIAREAMLEQFNILDAKVRQTARKDKVCRHLMTASGVGPIVSLSFKSAIDNPHRFKHSKDVGAYPGLVPRKYQSGEIDYNGKISKCGDASARSALFEAALVILHNRGVKWSALKSWGVRVAQRRGGRRACVAVARKLAVIIREDALDNRYPQLFAYLTGNLTQTKTYLPGENFVAVFGDPDNVIAVVKNGVSRSCGMAHTISPFFCITYCATPVVPSLNVSNY